MNKLFQVLFLFLALFFIVDATHFRFGSISWQPTVSHNVIKFSSNFAFRITYFKSYVTDIMVGELITLGTLSFGGANQGYIAVQATVTAFDPVNDWFTASFTTYKEYTALASGAKQDYVAIFTDCCRISTLINNADQYWNITTNVQLDNSVALDKVNYAPVSGMLPIYQVVYGKNNNFRIIANDPNDDNSLLKYKFSTVYFMEQPSGMTVSDSGNCFFLPTQMGLFSTQIYIYDPHGAYVVVDFILQSIKEPGLCHSSCTNAGVNCDINSQCTGCSNTGSKTNDTCVSSNLPPFFITPPTPVFDATISFDVDVTKTFTISCKTPFSDRTATVQVANIPVGTTYVSTAVGQVTNVTYSWTPTPNQVGSYIPSAYCVDSTGLTSTVRSFTLFVGKPECGTGNIDPKNSTSCVCKTSGYDPLTKCFDCLNRYYGPTCQPAPDCIHGKINSGIAGDGKCLCDNGWTGAACDVAFMSSCSTLISANRSITYLNPSYINPSVVQVYLDDSPNYAIPTIISIPDTITRMDLFILIDANSASTTTWGYLKSYMSQFTTMVENICESTQYGIGYFSDSPVGSFNFQPSLAIGSDIVVGINTYSPSTYSSTTSGNSLLALTSAASTPLGWNSGSFKVIIILTDSDHSSSSAQITALTNSLVGTSVVPVVIGLNGISTPNWASAINGQGFGTVLKASTGSDWAIQAAAGIKTVLSKVVFKNKLIATGSAFVSGVPSTISLVPGQSTQQTVSGITLTKPVVMDYTINNPLATISAMGYGKVDILINYNRPPIATSTSISVNQNAYTFFRFAGTDADMNTLTFTLTTFLNPSVGIVAWNGVTVTDFPTKTYTNQDMMVFQPATNYVLPTTVQFTVSDGCTSSSGYFTFIVNKINQPPTCTTGLSTTTNGFNKVTTFKLAGEDLEDPTVNNVISNPSVLTAYGTLKYGNIDITATTKIPSNADITFSQTTNPNIGTSVQLSFKSIDSSNLVSSNCAHTISVSHTNFPPISSASTPISVIPLGSIDFSIVSTDSDFITGDNAKFTITSKTGGGAFYLCSDSNKSPIAINTVFTAAYNSNGKATYVGLCFVASLQNVAVANFATLSFTSTDALNGVSSIFTINVNVVGNRANDVPVVNQIPPYSCHQDYNDAPVATVDGTDSDATDQGNLIAIITTPPANGILYKVPLGSQSSSNIAITGKAPLKVYYVPNPGFVGEDTYSYSVMDTFNALATAKQVTVTVLPINHKPSVIVSSSSFNSTVGQSNVANLVTSDIDGNVVKCSVVKVPDQIQMYDSNGVQITNANIPYQLSGVSYYFKLDNPAATTPKYSSITNLFTVNCVDSTTLTVPYGSLSTGDISENVYYNYINIAPTANSNTFDCDQDSFIAFALTGSDVETVSSSLQVKVVSLTNFGTLSVNGVVLTSSDIESKLYSLNSFTYTPNTGLSNWDTIDNQGPLDSFSFAVVDQQSLTSNSAVISFSVKPQNAPIYTGADTIDVLQNTRYPLIITGKIGNGGKEINVKVIGFTQNGTLYNVYNMGVEGSMDKEILAYPNDQYGQTAYYFAYRPPTNRYGPNFDTILFQLYDGDVYSMIYTITVNVIHVNQPPTIELISYNVLTDGITPIGEISFDGSRTVNMLINTSVVIKYLGADIDNQIPPLESTVPNVPLRGLLYSYDPTSVGLIGTVITRNSRLVQQHTDGFWYVVYVPRKSNWGDRYARIPLDVLDEFGLVSSPVTVIINVVTINIPPFVNITKQQNYTALTGETFPITTLTFDDPDSIFNNVSIVVSIVLESTNEIAPLSNINFTLTNSNPNCLLNSYNASMECIGNKNALNALISTISITSITPGNYKLVLFVNDLGYNAPQSIRSSSHLTATDNIPFSVVEPEVTTKENNNKTVLSAAIAGAAVGAAIIAAAVWKLVKKAAPPTDAFFGENGWVGDGVSHNPLYIQSTTAGTNPLYDTHLNSVN